FLEGLLSETARLKRMILDYPWKNISAAETANTVSISLLIHKNPEVDMAAEFAKFRIWVYSGCDFDTLTKNTCRFRVPAAKDMDRVMEALKAIDAID
ncbi:MAG: histidinol-phosphate aminotransferase family protein, partial [Anaerotignum sp.]|nr:histidinol-phosphate aminotransferase family protein [Anaerotignum sp.]